MVLSIELKGEFCYLCTTKKIFIYSGKKKLKYSNTNLYGKN